LAETVGQQFHVRVRAALARFGKQGALRGVLVALHAALQANSSGVRAIKALRKMAAAGDGGDGFRGFGLYMRGAGGRFSESVRNIGLARDKSVL
jgi:hypothetical protein